MLLHLQGENTFVSDTLCVASLYAGLCADCPFGTWVSHFPPASRPALAAFTKKGCNFAPINQIYIV